MHIGILTHPVLPLLPGWWRRQWKLLCVMPKLPSVCMPQGWEPSRHCSRAVHSSSLQADTRPHRGEGLGRYPIGRGRVWAMTVGIAVLCSLEMLSLEPAASSLSLWSESWREAGTSARPSGSWHPLGPPGPAPGCTYWSYSSVLG